MSAETEPTRYLPSISEVHAADEALGRFMSELNHFAGVARTFRDSDVPLDDAFFLSRSGIGFEDAPRHVDTAVIARLLVFADDAIEVADVIRDEAAGLRQTMLHIYRDYVIDRCDRRSSPC